MGIWEALNQSFAHVLNTLQFSELGNYKIDQGSDSLTKGRFPNYSRKGWQKHSLPHDWILDTKWVGFLSCHNNKFFNIINYIILKFFNFSHASSIMSNTWDLQEGKRRSLNITLYFDNFVSYPCSVNESYVSVVAWNEWD